MESCISFATRLVDRNLKHILEFGVYKGRSLQVLSNSFDSSFQIFGFDSFEGLPQDWTGTSLKKGAFSTNGKIPSIKRVTFFKGWFKDTIPQYLMIAQNIGLLHVDSDLYDSAKEVLYGINEYIVKNTILVFDEWYYNHDPKFNDGEQRAFYEWTKDCRREYEFINYPGCENPRLEKKIVRILR